MQLLEQVSAREAEMLAAIRGHQSNAQIAARLQDLVPVRIGGVARAVAQVLGVSERPPGTPADAVPDRLRFGVADPQARDDQRSGSR